MAPILYEHWTTRTTGFAHSGPPGASLAETAKHDYEIKGEENRLELTAWFSPQAIEAEADTVAGVQAASREHWRQYWTTGGAIDLSGNDDPRAAELERRIVLSQYVMAVHDAGSLPPQETGLAVNSWFGKFHMEMYWWHAAHWALWGRPEILEKSLSHLTELMPPGREMAKREGCQGVKWSKMTDPSGVESPSGIGPVLVWQQPHPIYLAELVWRAHRDRATLDKYKEIVFETADYMATFVDYDRERKQYVLGPGVASAEEKHTDYAHNLNPTMELGYWKWALETAQDWRVRLGMPRNEKWQDVIDHLAPLTIRNGVYPTLEFPDGRSRRPDGHVVVWNSARPRHRSRCHAEYPACRTSLRRQSNLGYRDGGHVRGTNEGARQGHRFARWEKREELVPRLRIHRSAARRKRRCTCRPTAVGWRQWP